MKSFVGRCVGLGVWTAAALPVVLTGLLVLTLPLALPAVGAEKPQGEAPLAGLPSAPGSHVEQIKALGDGQWLALGEPAPDLKWGPAPGRAYTNKMAYAPDLVGAFLFGEGVHGAHGTGPREGHYNDDVFFYDLMAHRYICVYPGTRTKDFEVSADRHGFLTSSDGQHLPIAIAVHGYECMEYIPRTRELMVLQTGSPYARGIKSRVQELVGDRTIHFTKEGQRHPYFYQVDTHRWQRRLTEGEGPRTRFADSLFYLPDRHQSVLYQRSGHFWFYDHNDPAWRRVAAENDPPDTVTGRSTSEGTLCYDSKRDRVYVINRQQLSIPWTYDPRSNTFADLKAKNQPYPPTNSYEVGQTAIGSTTSNAHYDTVADVVVMRLAVRQGSGEPVNIRPKTLGLLIYDPVENAWGEQPVPLPEDADIRGSWNSFYSPELNVHVFHIARDSRTNGRVYVYRHRRAMRDEP